MLTPPQQHTSACGRHEETSADAASAADGSMPQDTAACGRHEETSDDTSLSRAVCGLRSSLRRGTSVFARSVKPRNGKPLNDRRLDIFAEV